MSNNQLLLTHFEYSEHVNDQQLWHIRKTSLEAFNLVLGDNAQGKSRFFGALKLLKLYHTGVQTLGTPGSIINMGMTFADGTEVINYNLKRSVGADGVSGDYSEEISRQGKTLFSRKTNTLFRESDSIKLENFFIPPTAPVVSSISGPDFRTFSQLKSFFERMLFLDANRFAAGNVEVARDALILSTNGANIGSVMDTWQRKMPSVFTEVVSEFQDCFSFVVRNSVVAKDAILPNHGIQVPFVFYKDKESNSEIQQNNWSDGMLRTMCLLALIATRFPQPDNEFLRPSIVCVDEIENGLDFNTSNNVISFYESYSNIVQSILVSHSPSVCNMVEPKFWRVAKRKGTTVELFAPREKEPQLDEKRKKLMKDNWDFYKNHIARSSLYSVH